MSFSEKIKNFFSLMQESNFDFATIYAKEPVGVYILLAVVLFLIFIVFLLIRNSMKVNETVKLVSKIQDSKDSREYDQNLTKLANELPKRGIKVAQTLNAQKNDILNQELNLVKDLDIKQKIDKYKQMSSAYALMSSNSTKYKIEELTSFYDEKSKSLLEENLLKEIDEYCQTATFNENEVENVNAIVSYANSTEEPENILNPLQMQINRLSYGYNVDLYKFIKGLDEEKSGLIYTKSHERLDSLFQDEEGVVSEAILNFMIEDGENEKVYEYIKNLRDQEHLKLLSDALFAKKDNIDLDLAFVENELSQASDYKTHLDSKLTENWKDLSYLQHIVETPRVLESIGHTDYRNVIERVDKLQTQEDNNKAIAQALESARRAEELAKEAKAIARSK